MYNIVLMYFDHRDGNKGKFKLLRNGVLIHSLKMSNHKNKFLKEMLMSSLIKIYNLASKVYKYTVFFRKKSGLVKSRR